ncbi:MAG: MFS transporter, partial [Roseiflexaceae bacterium]
STIGAIAGPALVAPTGALAVGFSAPALAGPWFASAFLFLLGFILIGIFLRPDPSDLARLFAPAVPAGEPVITRPMRPWRAILSQPATQVAILAMVVGQLVMVMVMAMTSLYMTHNGHGLGDVSIVIMAHTLGMYGLSIFNGTLIERMGHKAAIGAGAALLIAGSLLAPVSLMTAWLALALFLVGLGWNLCYIAGSSLLSNALAPAERSRVQGTNELVINLSSAVSSLGSGAILAYAGFAALGMIGAVLALVPLAALAWQALSPARVAQPAPLSSD